VRPNLYVTQLLFPSPSSSLPQSSSFDPSFIPYPSLPLLYRCRPHCPSSHLISNFVACTSPPGKPMWHPGSYPFSAHRPPLILRPCASRTSSAPLLVIVLRAHVSAVLCYLFKLPRWSHRLRHHRKVPRHRFDDPPISLRLSAMVIARCSSLTCTSACHPAWVSYMVSADSPSYVRYHRVRSSYILLVIRHRLASLPSD
jgi:hypothetical protein